MIDKKLIEKVSFANDDYENIKRHFITFYENFSKFDEKVNKFGISNGERCGNNFSLKFLDITFSVEMSFVILQNENKGKVTFSREFIKDGVEKKEKIGTELFIDKRGNMMFGDNFGLHVQESYYVEEVVVKWLNEYLEYVSYK